MSSATASAIDFLSMANFFLLFLLNRRKRGAVEGVARQYYSHSFYLPVDVQENFFVIRNRSTAEKPAFLIPSNKACFNK